MSFGLARGRTLDDSAIGVDPASFPSLPDDLLQHPEKAHLSIASWFAHPERPLEIEIGSGKGTFILGQAQADPMTNYLGIEYAHEFYLYAADRIRRAQLPNVRMLCTDAAEFVHWRVPSACCQVVHLYFADPWPKARHHRRRMIQDRFLEDCLRVLKPGGELRVVTDHMDYWAWMERHFERWCAPHGPYQRLPFTPPTTARDGELVGTNFERKYREEGRGFNATILRKPA
jgi:tRNA (guanine-N7-)-methyltransferase